MKHEFKRIVLKFSLFTFLYVFFICRSINAASVITQAAVSSPSATPTTKKLSPTPSIASPSTAPTDEKVQEIRDVVKEKVQEKIQEIKDKIEKKGYVGILNEMTDSSLTLDTISGEKIVTVDSEAKIIGTNKKEIKLKDLEIEQKLICMGTIGENNILVAKRIVVVANPLKNLPQRLAFIGRISEINSKLKTIRLDHLRKIEQKYSIKVDTKVTKFITGDFTKLKVDDILVVVSSSEKENETPTAVLVKPL